MYLTCLGSSPRAWGTHDRLSEKFHPGRFNTHEHGERGSTLCIFCEGYGSSPRAWGTLSINAGIRLPGRFIPTSMGNASCAKYEILYLTVHPHEHGERLNIVLIQSIGHGSSPRAWGTREVRRIRSRIRRFIPTSMGNAEFCHCRSQMDAVHPHEHGERRCFQFRRL